MKMLAIALASFATASLAATPDFFADRLVSDGIGHVDTGYMYVRHDDGGGVTTRTTRVSMRFYTENCGRGGATSPVRTSNVRTIVGYHDSTGRSYIRFTGTEGMWAQVAHAGDVMSVWTPDVSDHQFTLDYEKGTLAWNTSNWDGLVAGKNDAGRSYWAFALSNTTEAYWCPGVLELEELSFYERVGGGSETTARHFVPCYKDGKPALYDTETQAIVYPTSDGFTVSGCDVTLAADSHVQIAGNIVNLRSLALASGVELEFVEPTALAPSSEVQLPDVGVVTVSLDVVNGSGRYVLIENLPSDFALSKFTLGSIPAACTGVLSKDGDKLVLTISDDGRIWPEAIAETLSSDGAGYVDLAYKYRTSAYPKTARVTCDFYSKNMGKGAAPGPTTTVNNRAVFGYQENATSISYARYTGDKAQVWFNNWGNYSAWTWGLQSFIEIDYLNATAFWSWKAGTESMSCDAAAPTSDAGIGYYLFAVNMVGELSLQSVIDFQKLCIYETSDGTTETLAHEYVPCVNAGRYGVYDTVGCAVYPVLSDTNGFSAANAKWRLRVNGEVRFVTGAQTFAAPADGSPAGWVLVRDNDGRIAARGDGTTASFAMPECGASLVWTENAAVDAGSVRNVGDDEYLAALTLGDGSALSFACGATITLSKGLVLPTEGTVSIVRAGISAAGTYVLMHGVGDPADLGRFEAAGLPSGLSGTVERTGDMLVLRVTGTSLDQAALPDMIVDSFRGDGAGYFDTLYKYHASSYPKTSRVTCDYYVESWGCYGPRKGFAPLISTIFGYQESSDQRCSIARINQYKWMFFYRQGSCANWNGNGNTHIEIDYAHDQAYWSWSDGSVTTNIPASLLDTDLSYYLMANNLQGKCSNTAVIDFKSLKFYETSDGTDETLVRDFIPAWKDGKPCIYDNVTKAISTVRGDTNGFTWAGAKWPSSIYTTVVTQTFADVRTVSMRPVPVPEFAPMTSFDFVTDGEVVMLADSGTVTVGTYGANGDLISSAVHSGVLRGDAIGITVGSAAKAVVTLSDIQKTVESTARHFEIADTLSVGEVFCRPGGRRKYEFMIASETTFTFANRVQSVWSDAYDAGGNFLGSTLVSSGVSRDTPWAATIPAGASYCILRVTVQPIGSMLLIR